MNGTLSIARTGMQAAQQSLDASAQNLANAGVTGYRRLRVEASTQAEGGVSTQALANEAPGTDLAADIVQQKVALYSFQANSRSLRTQDDMLGSLLDVRA